MTFSVYDILKIEQKDVAVAERVTLYVSMVKDVTLMLENLPASSIENLAGMAQEKVTQNCRQLEGMLDTLKSGEIGVLNQLLLEAALAWPMFLDWRPLQHRNLGGLVPFCKR